MNGKGMAPKAGYNHAAYRENWDAIFNKSSTPYVKTMKPTNAYANATKNFVTGHAAMHYDPCPPASGLLKIFGMRPSSGLRPVRPTHKPVKARPIGKPARTTKTVRRPSSKK